MTRCLGISQIRSKQKLWHHHPDLVDPLTRLKRTYPLRILFDRHGDMAHLQVMVKSHVWATKLLNIKTCLSDWIAILLGSCSWLLDAYPFIREIVYHQLIIRGVSFCKKKSTFQHFQEKNTKSNQTKHQPESFFVNQKKYPRELHRKNLNPLL